MALIDLILFALAFVIMSLPLGFTSTLFLGGRPIKAMLPRAVTKCTAQSSSPRRE